MLESAIVVSSPLLAWLITRAVRTHAIQAGLIDSPNARSLHVVPTPLGGGLGFVAAVSVAAAVLSAFDNLDWQIAAICLGPGAAVALVGYIDDRRGLSASMRLAVHMAGAALVVALTWPWPDIVGSGWFGQSLLVIVALLVIGWFTNLYNFMDGIDGLAGSEAVFVFGGAAALSMLTGQSSSWTTLLCATSLSIVGFLWWNWHPARIFMGDVGSGFLGFLVGSFGVATWVEGILSPFTWLILSSLFVADSTITLLRRVARRERWYAAHRSHAYQWAARTRLGHGGVTRCSCVWNLSVVLPIAFWSAMHPRYLVHMTIGLMVVTCGLVVAFGAGRPERIK